MSEPASRQRPSIDLDEFERRMRLSTAGASDDDPLAELARLVGEQPDPYQDVFAQEAVTHAGYDHAAHDHAAQDHTTYHDHTAYDERQEPAFAEPAFADPSPRLAGSFAAIEAGLRGGISPHHDLPAGAPGDHGQYQDQYPAYADQPYAYAPQYAAPAAKSRRPIYIMAATIVAGILGVGGAFALKGHGTSPSDVKTIMAANGPTKIQPPADTASDSGAGDSAVLGKSGQTAPTKLVGNEEDPVDVNQAVKDNAAKDAATKDAVSPEAPAVPTTDASSVPVPPFPGQAAADPSQAIAGMAASPAGDFALGMPAPKKVKVVSVRPDGTILSDDQPPAASAMPDVTAAPPIGAGPVPKASTPRAPKSASRVLPTHVANASDDAATPDAAAPKPAHKAKVSKTKPMKVAMADPADGTSDAKSSDAKSADNQTNEPASKGSGGGFAVQLAAPGSEADAKSASSKLARKFASALEGRHLGFHKAESNGRSVYRVRVSSLSRDEAVTLCEKLKSDGGTCFVAHN